MSSSRGAGPKRASKKSKTPKRAQTALRVKPVRRTSRAATIPTGTIRILIADDLLLDRSGLAAILRAQPDFEVVGETSSTLEAAKLARELKPSIVILALRLQPIDGRTPLASLHAASPETPILAVAERGDQGGPGAGKVEGGGADFGGGHGACLHPGDSR